MQKKLIPDPWVKKVTYRIPDPRHCSVGTGAVLRIHTTMMWIRIRLLITGGDPDPAFDFDADPEVTTKNDLSNFLPR